MAMLNNKNWTNHQKQLARELRKDGLLLKSVRHQDESLCLIAVNQNGLALMYVKKQTKAICLAAVSQHKHAIKFVKRQSKEICLTAVEHYGAALEFCKIKNGKIYAAALYQDSSVFKDISKEVHTKNMCKIAVSKNGYNLKYINSKFLTEELQILAIQNCGSAMQFIKNPSNELKEVAIISDPRAIQFIKNPEDDLKILVVKNLIDPGLQWVFKQTQRICLIAVKHNYLNLKYVQKKNFSICKAAVLKDPRALAFVDEKFQTEQLCSLAVKRNGDCIKFVKNQTRSLCIEAINTTPLSVHYVRNQTYSLCLLAIRKYQFALGSIHEQSLKICLESIKLWPDSYKLVKIVEDNSSLESVMQGLVKLKIRQSMNQAFKS